MTDPTPILIDLATLARQVGGRGTLLLLTALCLVALVAVACVTGLALATLREAIRA